MKKAWKKILAALCAAAMLITMPGMCVLADEMQEEAIVTEAEVPEEIEDFAEFPDEDATDVTEEEIISLDEDEEVVGEGPIQVGDGVTATFDADTGAVEFTSQDGELWRYWVDALGVRSDEIKSIKVASGTVYLPADSSSIFSICYYYYTSNLTSLDLSSFDTSNVTNMAGMFSGCRSLPNLDLSSFDTSNVTNMDGMFSGCNSLTSLDLSSFNTSNVTNMLGMFNCCESLTNLGLSSFDTSNVTNMEVMFLGCSSLNSLDLSSFDTSNVTNMVGMFSGCNSLTTLDLSIFDTSNVSDMGAMFQNCSSLINLDLSIFDTSNVTDMGYMFESCSMTNLDLSSFDTSKVTNMSYMFWNCDSLTNLDVSNFDTSNVERMNSMFAGCSGLTDLNVSNFNTSNVTDMGGMFYYCNSLPHLDVSNFDTSNVERMSSMFSGCSGLTDLDVSNFDTSNVTDMREMFSMYGQHNDRVVSKLTSLNLSSFDTSNVTDMEWMFSGCSSLTNLDLSSFNTSNVTYTTYMFSGCSSLTNLDLSSFDTSKVTEMYGMFYNCSSLTNLDLSSFDTSNVTYMDGMFSGCSNLTDLDLSSFDTSNVTDMGSMFSGCSSLTTLDVSSFDTSNVTDMGAMFYYCNSLPHLDVSNFDTSNVERMSSMFSGCSGLTDLDVSNFDTSNVTSMGGMFSGCSNLTELGLSSFDTSNVKYMNYMFYGCSSLTNLDLSSFNTSNVMYMSYMFYGCSSLTNLDLSSFDTSNVEYMEDREDMEKMLYGCYALELLKTPKKNEKPFELPVTMYDDAGNKHNKLPSLSESIVLTRNKPTTKMDISDCEIILSATRYAYDGKAKKPTVTVMDGSTILNSGIDYIVSYADNINPGIATVKVTGIGNYKGEKYVTFMIDGGNWIDNTGIPHYYTIALQATSTGRYITCDVGAKNAQGRYKNMDDPHLNADATRVMAYEEFELVPCSDGSYALRSVMNRKFITYNTLQGLKCDADFVNDDEKLIMTKGAKGLIKFQKKTLNDRWLCVKDGKLQVTDKADEAEVFNQILIDDNSYTETEIKVLSQDEWFDLDKDNQGKGGLYDIQKDVGINSYNNAETLKKLGYTLMYESGKFDREYVEVNRMQCFVAYKKIKGKYEVVVAFQGTEGYDEIDKWSDRFSNLTGDTYTDDDGMHVGYHLMSNKLVEFEEKIIDKEKKLTLSTLISYAQKDKAHFTIIGHSMGGAIAQCYALHLVKDRGIEKSKITGRTFNSALAVDKDDTDFTDWYNICVSTDTVCNGLVPGSIIYYGIHRIGTTIWLYDMEPDIGTGHFPKINIATDKHNMDKSLYSILHNIWCGKKCDHAWDEGTVETFTYVPGDQVQYERIYTCSKCKQRKNIKVTPLSNNIEVTGLKSKTYTGKAITQTLVLKNGDVKLQVDTDYVVSYKDNINAGTATVMIEGQGSYLGTIIKTFKINKANAKLAFAEGTVTKKTTDEPFTNTLTKTTDGTVTYKSSNTNVATVNSTSGLVTIKGGGTTTITATASEGKNYKAGSASYTLTVKVSAGFSDVQDPSHPYYNAIYWAAGEGITKGYSDGTFGIDRSCTRGEMMMFLWKYAGKPAPKAASKSPFKDVPTNHAFYKAILWGYQKGITKGYSDGTFGINRDVSRGEAMMFLWKLKGKPAPKATSKSPFKDVPTNHAFYKAILWGSQKGITKGYTSGPKKGNFGINDNCTRGQIVTFLYRAKDIK